MGNYLSIGPLADVFAIQSEVAVALAAQLRRNFVGREAAIKMKPTNDLMAYDSFVRARSLIDTSSFSSQADRGLLEAARLLEEAIARDSRFFALIANWLAFTIHFTFIMLIIRRARAMADNAIEKAMDTRSERGRSAFDRAYHLYSAYLDYDVARRELGIASSLLPNEPRCFELAGFMDRRAGDWEGAVKAFLKALEWIPAVFICAFPYRKPSSTCVGFPEKARVLDQAIAIAPDDIDARLARAFVDWNGAPTRNLLRTAVEQALAKDPSVAAEVAEEWFYVAACQRDWEVARRAMAAAPDRDVCRTENVAFPTSWCEGFVARAQGDSATAQKAFLKARAESEKMCANNRISVKRSVFLGLSGSCSWRKGEGD